jgi:hypothetical protein
MTLPSIETFLDLSRRGQLSISIPHFMKRGHTIAACHFGRGVHSTVVLPRGSSGMLDRNGRLIKGVWEQHGSRS